jgi:hypothetical protein
MKRPPRKQKVGAGADYRIAELARSARGKQDALLRKGLPPFTTGFPAAVVADDPFERLGPVGDRHTTRHVIDQRLILAVHDARISERNLLSRLGADEIRAERLFHLVLQTWLEMTEAYAIEHSRHLFDDADSHTRPNAIVTPAATPVCPTPTDPDS